MSRHHNLLSKPAFAEPRPLSEKPKEAPESSTPQAVPTIPQHSDVYTFRKVPEGRGGGGMVVTCPSDVAVTSLTLGSVEFRGKKNLEASASSRPQAMHNIPRHVDIYTLRNVPGMRGGMMITCPSDVAVKSLTPTRVEFRRKRKLETRWRNMGLEGN